MVINSPIFGEQTSSIASIQLYPQTRSYMDFPGVNAAMDALVKMYEHKLKELNPTVQNITYDVTDLYNFMDNMHDLCALV